MTKVQKWRDAVKTCFPADRLIPEEMGTTATVRIISGAHDGDFDLAGKSVGAVRRAFRDVFSIRDDAEAYVGGAIVAPGHILHPNSTLEFLVRWGVKGVLEPDELEMLRRIDARVGKMAEEGLFQLRLNEVEKELLRVLCEGKPLRGEVLADEIKRDFDSNFKATLAALVRHGLLASSRESGYFVPPAVKLRLDSTTSLGKNLPMS